MGGLICVVVAEIQVVVVPAIMVEEIQVVVTEATGVTVEGDHIQEENELPMIRVKT